MLYLSILRPTWRDLGLPELQVASVNKKYSMYLPENSTEKYTLHNLHMQWEEYVFAGYSQCLEHDKEDALLYRHLFQ